MITTPPVVGSDVVVSASSPRIENPKDAQACAATLSSVSDTARAERSAQAGPSGQALSTLGDFGGLTITSLLSREEAARLHVQELRLERIVEMLQDPDAVDQTGKPLTDADRAMLRDMGVQALDDMSDLVRRKIQWLEKDARALRLHHGKGVQRAVKAVAATSILILAILSAKRLLRFWRGQRQDSSEQATAPELPDVDE